MFRPRVWEWICWLENLIRECLLSVDAIQINLHEINGTKKSKMEGKRRRTKHTGFKRRKKNKTDLTQSFACPTLLFPLAHIHTPFTLKGCNFAFSSCRACCSGNRGGTVWCCSSGLTFSGRVWRFLSTVRGFKEETWLNSFRNRSSFQRSSLYSLPHVDTTCQR